MLKPDLNRVRANVQNATTEDLLDRITVYREGMEAEAVTIIEEELRQRDVSTEQIENHRQARAQHTLHDPDGLPLTCSRCQRPAIQLTWGWHYLWGKLPVFPRKLAYCEQHRRAQDEAAFTGPDQ